MKAKGGGGREKKKEKEFYDYLNTSCPNITKKSCLQQNKFWLKWIKGDPKKKENHGLRQRKQASTMWLKKGEDIKEVKRKKNRSCYLLEKFKIKYFVLKQIKIESGMTQKSVEKKS